eukprot:s139_g11.t1
MARSASCEPRTCFQQIEGQVHHPAPSVARELVAAVVMDQPNVNKACMRTLSQKYEGIAFLPCSRSLLTPRVVCGPPCRSWQIVVPARGHWPPGRSTTAGYLAVRTSRYYPSYKQVKRAYEMNLPAYVYYSSEEGVRTCAKCKHFDSVSRLSVRKRHAFVQIAKYFVTLLKPLLLKLRVVDAAKFTLPRLLIHLVDLRARLTEELANLGTATA